MPTHGNAFLDGGGEDDFQQLGFATFENESFARGDFQ